MDGWMDLWIHERPGELRLEADQRRLVRELKAAKSRKRGGGVTHLLRGLSGGVASLAKRTALSADSGVGRADGPGVARQPGRACDAPAR